MPRSSIEHDRIFTVLKKGISILFSHLGRIYRNSPTRQQRSWNRKLFLSFISSQSFERKKISRANTSKYAFDADHRTFPEGLHPTTPAMTSVELFAKDFLFLWRCHLDIAKSGCCRCPKLCLTAAQLCKAISPDRTPPRILLVTSISKYFSTSKCVGRSSWLDHFEIELYRGALGFGCFSVISLRCKLLLAFRPRGIIPELHTTLCFLLHSTIIEFLLRLRSDLCPVAWHRYEVLIPDLDKRVQQ